MFEVIGYGLVRLVGWGWLWGRESYRALKESGHEVYGNGGVFMLIGMASLVILCAGMVFWR